MSAAGATLTDIFVGLVDSVGSMDNKRYAIFRLGCECTGFECLGSDGSREASHVQTSSSANVAVPLGGDATIYVLRLTFTSDRKTWFCFFTPEELIRILRGGGGRGVAAGPRRSRRMPTGTVVSDALSVGTLEPPCVGGTAPPIPTRITIRQRDAPEEDDNEDDGADMPDSPTVVRQLRPIFIPSASTALS